MSMSCSISRLLKSVGTVLRSRHLNLDVIFCLSGSLDSGMAAIISSVQGR